MSTVAPAEGTLIRQPPEVIERLSAALEVARDQRDDANDRHTAAAWLLAHALADGMTRDDVPEWVQDFRDAEEALAGTREAWMVARVEWYHARGMHASKDVAGCCQPGEQIATAEGSR